MSYIGNTNTTQAFTPAVDFFSGNASTTAFTLSRPVASVAQVQAVISNVPQDPGSAYTVSGNTITFTSAPPSGTNNIYVSYTSPITQVIAPSQGTVGTTQIQNGVTVNFADGSAAAPSITNDGDTNTGIFFPAADTIAFAEGGVESMRIDSSGNVGIGTTTIGQKLVIESNSSQLRLRNTTTRYRSDYTIDSSGNMEINSYDDTASAYKQIKLNGSPLIFSVDTEKMRIDSSGNLLVGTATNSLSTRIFASGTIGAQQTYGPMFVSNENNTDNVGRGSFNFQRGGTQVGQIVTTNSTCTYTSSSDYRLKENIIPMTGALNKVAQLNPVTYKWKSTGTDGQGFIAHELQEVVPDCVTGEKDAVDAEGNPQYQGVDTSFLVATLTAAIQEQQAIITALTARITALENT